MLTLITIMIKCLQVSILYLWFTATVSSKCFVFNVFLFFLFFWSCYLLVVVIYRWNFFCSKTELLAAVTFRNILLMLNILLYFWFFSFLQLSSNKDLHFWHIYPEGDLQMHMGDFTDFFLRMLFPTTAGIGITS